MKRLLLIFPLLIITLGCVELEEERNPDYKIDLYSYYTQNPKYAYNLNTQVETVEHYPSIQYYPTQKWTFLRHQHGSGYLFTEREELHIVAYLNPTSIYVVLFNVHVPANDTLDYYVFQDEDTIDIEEQYEEETESMFSSKYTTKRYMPFPVVESTNFTPTYIKMDNGSVCYRSSKSTVYSSQYGVLFDLDSLSNDYYSSVVQITNNDIDSEIPYLINEFLAKEQYLANN